LAIFLSGCPKSSQEAKQGQKAEELQDYDTALLYYQRALRADPTNTEYKLKAARLRFEASNYHLSQGEKLKDKGDLALALAEFQKAASIDPANSQAAQEVQHVLEALAARAAAENPAAPPVAPSGPMMMEGPPQLKPLSKDHIPNLKMTNDSKIVFQTIANLADLTVVFDPEFQGKRIPFEARNLTLQEALDIAALQSKAFWKPITGNIIFVASGDPAKRKEYEEEIVRVFYLTNITADKDLTEIVTAIRNMFTPALSKMNVITAQNAIVVRDTPDKVLLVGKLISALDKAKAEVVVEVSIAEVNLDNQHTLGVSPSTSASLTFAPPSTSTTTSGSAAVLALNELRHLSTADYNINLPSATVTALLSNNNTKILQNPEIRAVDGQKASLKIGDRVPVATGSFQAGVGAGLGTAGAGVVSPLVNTQFQYQDVGVNIDITPRILPDRDVAMHIKIEVSAVTSNVNIGGINQPVISQRVIEHDVRLKDGEVNVLGGLIQRTDTTSIAGWPGLAKIPIMRYLFSTDAVEHKDDEILVVLTPRVVRMPNITPENLRSIATGTDQNPQVHFVEDAATAPVPAPQPTQSAPPPQGVPVIGTITPPAATAPPVTSATPGGPATLRFEPGTISLKPGDTTTVGIVVENVKDLSSIPMLLQYNPAVISVEEVRHGGFLSADSQAAIVQQPNQAHGQEIISVTRTPNSAGISGTGTVVAVVIKALAAGNSQLSIVQVNARDSQQRPIQLVTVEGAVKVQ
jgi:general secretion pathway protein D